jgi:MSHA pilin protein MshA
LIELIVVILILGVLAAAALPRFISAQTDARVAKMQAIFGAMRSAAALAKARCELDIGRGLNGPNQCGNATPRVNMDGLFVPMVNRYPEASTAGIVAAAQLDTANDGLTVTAGNPLTITLNSATDQATCFISYTEAGAGAAPIISLTTSGC